MKMTASETCIICTCSGHSLIATNYVDNKKKTKVAMMLNVTVCKCANYFVDIPETFGRSNSHSKTNKPLVWTLSLISNGKKEAQ